MDRIVAFDIETPNFNNDRMCSIGLSVIENGEIVQTNHYLVNPECDFDDRNIQIHGITPSDVAGAPTFPEIWAVIAPLFRANLVTAHNATFDLCVLKKVLQAYGINESLIYYTDTLTIARAMIKEANNHRLPTLCEWFSIPLEHHNAGSDSQACASLLCNLVKMGADLNRYIKAYEFVVTPSAPEAVSESAFACARLSIRGKSICLSGEFDCGSKSEIGEKLISCGASIQTAVTQKTDILLVGGHGSSAWCAGNYGTKVKKAMELQAKGIAILLMREADFFAALEE